MIKGAKERANAAKFLAKEWYGSRNLQRLSPRQFQLVTTAVATAGSLEELKAFVATDKLEKP